MSKRARAKQVEKNSAPASQSAWISLRTGFITITIVSLALATWTTLQATAVKGLGESILWGLAFGGSIWLIFLLAMLFNRWVRRNK